MGKIKKKALLNRGFVNVLLVLLIIILAIVMTGTLTGKKFNRGGSPLTGASFTCCDTGDGEACKPQTSEGQLLSHVGQEYGLLKSNITLSEGIFHLKDSGEVFNGNPVILNTSDGYNSIYHTENSQYPCPGEAITGVGGCVRIPDDMLLYVCKTNCFPAVPSDAREIRWCGAADGVDCYGSKQSTYDVFFRMSDLADPGIPDVIKYCVKPANVTPIATEPTIVLDEQEERENLQLVTFKIINQAGSIPWLSPWCKPAIYLYPEDTSLINVKVSSQEPFTYTDPLYPAEGWSVIADENGKITYLDKSYDYLYYETKIKDTRVKKPESGYVLEKNKLAQNLRTIVANLGLNVKETNQFVDYWTGVLPDSPYYFIGIVPQNEIAGSTTLSINPRPGTVIRVTLYFETLNQKIEVQKPQITTPKRSGFTVVEWGGIFKKHKDEPFTCLM